MILAFVQCANTTATSQLRWLGSGRCIYRLLLVIAMVRLGLFIYALALFTSFMHVWEVYARYGGEFPVLDRVWVALGVALGLDLTAIYYSYLAVKGVKSARLGSYLAVSLVWFAVLVSLLTNTTSLVDKLVAFILSSFVLVTTFFLGRVLGELSETPQWLSTKEVSERLGITKAAFLELAKQKGLKHMQKGRTHLWNWREINEAIQPGNKGDISSSTEPHSSSQ